MSDNNPPPKVLLWGGRSMARIIDEMLRETGSGVTTLIFDDTLQSPTFETSGMFTNSVKVLREHLNQVTHFVTCIGGEHGYARFMTSQRLQELGLVPLSLVHHKSYVEPTATLGAACHIMPFSVVHKFAVIGDYTILNTSCAIDHECVVGRGVHVMGSAAVAGRVTIGDYATIGTNATVLPSIQIGEGAFVGAGAVVTDDVKPHTVVAGVPARPLRANKLEFSNGSVNALRS